MGQFLAFLMVVGLLFWGYQVTFETEVSQAKYGTSAAGNHESQQDNAWAKELQQQAGVARRWVVAERAAGRDPVGAIPGLTDNVTGFVDADGQLAVWLPEGSRAGNVALAMQELSNTRNFGLSDFGFVKSPFGSIVPLPTGSNVPNDRPVISLKSEPAPVAAVEVTFQACLDNNELRMAVSPWEDAPVWANVKNWTTVGPRGNGYREGYFKQPDGSWTGVCGYMVTEWRCRNDGTHRRVRGRTRDYYGNWENKNSSPVCPHAGCAGDSLTASDIYNCASGGGSSGGGGYTLCSANGYRVSYDADGTPTGAVADPTCTTNDPPPSSGGGSGGGGGSTDGGGSTPDPADCSDPSYAASNPAQCSVSETPPDSCLIVEKTIKFNGDNWTTSERTLTVNHGATMWTDTGQCSSAQVQCNDGSAQTIATGDNSNNGSASACGNDHGGMTDGDTAGTGADTGGGDSGGETGN